MRRFPMVVCVALVACGGGDDQNGHLADAPLLIDGPNPDVPVPPNPPVTLTITNNGMPVPEVTVYFVNADDSLAAAARTDATGTASAMMAAGGSVTALNPFPGRVVVAAVVRDGDDLRTFLGVKPGDHLVLTGALPSVSFTLKAPADPQASAAADYLVLTSCGSASISPGGTGSGSGSVDPGGVITLFGCHGTADIMVLGRNSDFNPISALYHPNVAVTEGGIVDLTGDTYQPLTDLMFGYTNISPNAVAFSVSYALATARGAFEPLFNDGFGLGSGAATFTRLVPAIAGMIGVVNTSVSLNGVGHHHLIDWSTSVASYLLDLTGQLLPDMIDAPSFNPTTRRVSWIEDVVGATPDLTTAALQMTRGERTWHWELAAPYTPGEIKLPRLPTDVFDWTPTIDDTVVIEHVMNAKLPGRYDAVRAHMLDIEDKLDLPRQSPNQQDFSPLVAGASGRAVAVEFLLPPLAAIARVAPLHGGRVPRIQRSPVPR